MKVLIADDEYLVRSSLASMLIELDMQLEIIGEAKDGNEMVSMTKRHIPDAAFVDIRMPELNGFEAIKAAMVDSPNTHWVILTGFSEFEYAKEAIKLGAAAYLLKPVSPVELKETIGELQKRIRENNILLNTEFENELIALSHDLISLSDNAEEVAAGTLKFICAIITFDSFLTEKEKIKLQLEFFNTMKTAIPDLLSSNIRIALYPMPNGEIASVGAWDLTKAGVVGDNVKKYFDLLLKIADQYNSNQFSITILQSDICMSYGILQKQLNELQNLSSMRILISIGKRHMINELSSRYEKTPPDLIKLTNMLISLTAAFKEKAYMSYMKSLGDLETLFSIASHTIDGMISDSIRKYLLISINCRIDAGIDYTSWIKVLKNHGEKLLADAQKEENPVQDISKQVISLIERDYMYDIGIGQIAEQLNITPNYLSTVFHRKTGTTFMKYLTNIRMLKAKELLSNSNAQVQKVAEKVGYYSTRHFTKLFREHFGSYPSEYRDMFNNYH